jgi:hypothetical protein
MGAKHFCNAVFWFLLLVLVSWWVAVVSFPFYIFTSILTACISRCPEF